MGIQIILSYIFVGIISLYAINLNDMNLFGYSSFMFLAVLNDVLYRFKSMNIIFVYNKNIFKKKKVLTKIKHCVDKCA